MTRGKYLIKNIIIYIALAFFAIFTYIIGTVYCLEMMYQVIPCTNAYNIGLDIHCPNYLYHAIYEGSFYLLFVLIIFLIVQYLSKSFIFFIYILFLPTLYIVLVQLNLFNAVKDLNNIGPDKIYTTNYNEVYGFLGVYSLLLIGIFLLMYNWFRRNNFFDK